MPAAAVVLVGLAVLLFAHLPVLPLAVGEALRPEAVSAECCGGDRAEEDERGLQERLGLFFFKIAVRGTVRARGGR
jgi:hypothetical protein